MDNRYYDKVLNEIKPLFDEQGFKALEDGSFRNEKRAVMIEYAQETQSYVLKMAEVEGENVGEYAVVTTWLFDDTQTEEDAESVGMDFCETIRENIGAKLQKRISKEVELPSASKGESYNVTALTKKMLDVFPQFKEQYKAHVTHYGNFLYLEFFGKYFVPQITAVYRAGEKKEMKKLNEILNSGYVSGDKDAVNLMVAMLSAAVQNDQTAKENLFNSLSKNAHLVTAVENFIPALNKNARLKKLLVK